MAYANRNVLRIGRIVLGIEAENIVTLIQEFAVNLAVPVILMDFVVGNILLACQERLSHITRVIEFNDKLSLTDEFEFHEPFVVFVDGITVGEGKNKRLATFFQCKRNVARDNSAFSRGEFGMKAIVAVVKTFLIVAQTIPDKSVLPCRNFLFRHQHTIHVQIVFHAQGKHAIGGACHRQHVLLIATKLLGADGQGFFSHRGEDKQNKCCEKVQEEFLQGSTSFVILW